MTTSAPEGRQEAAVLDAKALTLGELQRAHVERQEEWCPEQKPDLSFRGNEMAGEVGEACNVIKKLERERHGWRGSRATKEQLAEELADVIHTATLCAITAGIDIEAATIAKFDATSEKNGLSSRIRALIPAKPAVEVVEALELERFTLHYDPVEEKLFALLSEDGEWVRHSDVYTLSPPTKTPTVELEPLRENLKRQAGILDEMAFKMRLPPGDNNLEDASAFMRDAVTALSQAPATPDAQTEVKK